MIQFNFLEDFAANELHLENTIIDFGGQVMEAFLYSQVQAGIM
jgi:hypothetical protein